MIRGTTRSMSDGEHTDVQASRLLDLYRGQRMVVRGVLIDVRSTGSSRALALIKSDEQISVRLWFSEPHVSNVSMLPKGAAVVVRGKVKDADAYAVDLDDCELV
jgi:hypothetical protein